ncbi:nuclear transcription factor Y subunit B-1 isoform X2 [Folsomia candida]|uniref:Nuclear transcription factor Y subunit beta n=1 Tax=Folsomia candida TaxID=158441 RepID=A0A226DYM6_FOLCA|nr:nuclear transcription factor Y subunit B-1 isoform X2 [Folsomia candida]OXA50393.1 Nuclear transcription factor Y subunit beta [Folsomia candida]
MDSASENEDLSTQFLHQHHVAGDQYILSGGSIDGDTEDSRDGDDERHTGMLREQDRFLPIANVARLMKRSIPKSGKIAKDARECVQECVSEFVSFITSEASDRCHQEKRKTINGEDILVAMTTLGFDNYVEPLKLYLQKYREANKGDKPLGIGESSSLLLSPSAVAGTMVTAATTSNTPVTTNTINPATVSAPPGTVVFTYADMSQVQVQQGQQQQASGQQEPEFIG